MSSSGAGAGPLACPETGEWPGSPSEQSSVSLAKLTVHGSVKNRVDATVKPGQVGTEHVEGLGGSVLLVCNVQDQKRDKTANKT